MAHGIGAAHATERTAQITEAGVREVFPGCQNGCSTNNAGAFHFPRFKEAVNDMPVPAKQLHRARSPVLDAYAVTEQKAPSFRVALFMRVFRFYADAYVVRDLGCHALLFLVHQTDRASLTCGPIVRIFNPTTFNTKMFRTVFPTMAIALVASASFAQRPTATFVGGSLVRLDLDGFRVFADAPMDHKGIGPDDIALYVTEPPTPVLGGRAFTPAFNGEVLDRRTERLGEKTGIYVNPRSTPLGETPHYSYIVQWNGRRVYFTGDTEDIKDLLETHDLDVAFVTPAIMAAFEKAGRVIEARTVVIYHTTNKEQQGASLSVPCDRCKVVLPTPGEVIPLFR